MSAILRHTKLTEHFRWAEFGQRDGTLPPRTAFPAYRDLCARFLEPLRALYGPVSVVSGYRTRAHNASVGGAPASRHMPSVEPGAVAADIVCARGTPAEWHAALDRLNPGGLGLYAGHVHVDNRRVRSRW